MDKDRIYSKHILEAIEEIEKFVNGMTMEQFAGDRRTILAVCRCLEIIGEATKRLSPSFREKYTHIPWRKIAGMRDFLIHDYMEVDVQEVWRTATMDLTVLKVALEM